MEITLGAMGRPLPGYVVELVDPVSGEVGDEGEICLSLDPRPAALMTGYRNEHGHLMPVSADSWYHTGDVAHRNPDGTITYVGRTDDVFKASDYRISPFELESVLVEHEAVAEAAVVPAPDPVRLAVPKAYVSLAAGYEPTTPTPRESILAALPGAARAVQAGPPDRVRRAAEDDLRQDPPGRAARRGERGGRPAAGRVPRGGLPGAARLSYRPAASRATQSRCSSVSGTGTPRA